MVKRELVPPDGGWGWVIVLASALSNLIIIPTLQSFGLLFKDIFTKMDLSHTDRSTIMNTNSACMMLMGLINGPLLKYFSFRKVALMGAALCSLGLILTSTATTFTQYMIYYGLITSFGMGMETSAFQLALNTYFKEKRNKATGFAMTITGLGPILMPQLINLLLQFYTTEQTIFIIGGLSLNAFVAAVLLQPVKWHMKENVALDAEDPIQGADDVEGLAEENKDQVATLLERSNSESTAHSNNLRRRKSSTYSVEYDHEMGAIYGFDTPLAGSVLSLTPATNNNNHRKQSIPEVTVNKWWSNASLNTVNLGSSIKIFDENNRRRMSSKVVDTNMVYDNEMSVKKTKTKNPIVKFLKGFVNFFDLKLLCDPVYVNVMVGMSLAIFAELNFSILTPFIMADFGMNISQTATFLSVLSIADLVFRFLAPFIGDYLKKPPRKMYMLTLFLLIISRFMLILFPYPSAFLWIAIALGVAKGVRTVYMNLVIPSEVPLDRLAAAAGLQMMVNGVFILIGGPILGVVRDLSGSYSNCIIVMNFITLSCILMWTVEMLYFKFKSPKTADEQEKLNTTCK